MRLSKAARRKESTGIQNEARKEADRELLARIKKLEKAARESDKEIGELERWARSVEQFMNGDLIPIINELCDKEVRFIQKVLLKK